MTDQCNEIKIVRFKGGLGNQMFQYAFLKNIEKVCNCKVKADFSYFNNFKNDQIMVPRILNLNINLNFASEGDRKHLFLFKKTLFNRWNILNKIFKIYFYESKVKYRDLKRIIRYKYFDGYWQSWRYVKNVEDILRNDFTLKKELNEKALLFIEKIKKENSVFIGVRTGDYLKPKIMKRLGILKEEYFNTAIDIIRKRVKNPKFYVFSMDPDWVKKNIKFKGKVFYREKEDVFDDLEELFVLGAFKHAIIANSTFYWWGAWLIKNKNKIVIAPKKWFKDHPEIDIVPPEWIKI